MGFYVGLALMGLGIILFIIGRLKSNTARVEARSGSIAVGGNNTGSINNINIGSVPTSAHSSNSLTYIAMVVELVGITVTLWDVFHVAAK